MDVPNPELNREYASDFFFVNRWMLRCAGLWRPESGNNHIQLFYKIYAVIVFIFVNLWFTSTEFVSLFYTYKNESELIKNINFFLTHFMGAVKVIFWYFNGRCLRGIMESLEDPQLQYQDYMQYKPGNLSKEYKTIGIKYSLLFLSLAHATLTSSYLPPIFTTIKYIKHEGMMDNSTVSLPTRLPYYSWMPFPYATGNMYLLAMAYQAGPMFSYAYSIVGMDTLFMNIMNCIAGNVKIIQGAFLTLRERCCARVNTIAADTPLHENEKMMAAMNTEMEKIIRHLQTVFKACDELERVHRYVTLCQVTATLFILCTSLYLVSQAPPLSKQFVAECVYLAAMFFQLYLYCSFGNEVTLKELPYHIWDSNWFATTTYFKKSMIFTMMRAKRPVYFTAGKFSPLTLPTFMSIIKTSYSIFALINNTSD